MSDKNKDKEELNQDAPTGGEDSAEAVGTSDAAPAQAQDVDDEVNAAAPSAPAESAESGESGKSSESSVPDSRYPVPDPHGDGVKKDKRLRLSGMYENWFIDYASYVILERAIPHIEDGLKPVQRRILHVMKESDDGHYTKVAGIVGDTMHYHPHGDASIGDALV